MNDIANLKIADRLYEVSGDYDGCAIIEASNLEELDKKIDQIRRLRNVSDTKTFVSLKKW